MPTSTSAFGFQLVNYGPLTTTFAAAPSCATESNFLQIAPSSAPDGFLYSIGCDITKSTFGQCYPSGATVDSNRARAATEVGYLDIGYFSPGLICPAGWKTVGVAAKANDGALSTSGAFSPAAPVVPPRSDLPYVNPPLNVLMGVIEPGETAVLCCPSSMTAGEGTCYSTLLNPTPTEGCLRFGPIDNVDANPTTISVYGTTISVDLLTITGTEPVSETFTTTFSGGEASPYVLVTFTPMVALVHTATDAPTTTSSPNSAVSGRTISGGGGAIWSVLIWAVSMTLGFVIFFSF